MLVIYNTSKNTQAPHTMAQPSGWYLIRMFHPDFKKIIIPKNGRIVIGRDVRASCIPLDQVMFRHVSKVHCVLQHIDGIAMISDNSSKGGTYVNGHRLSAANPGCQILKEGDKVGIGTRTNATEHFYKENGNVLFYRVCRSVKPEAVIVVSDDDEANEKIASSDSPQWIEIDDDDDDDDGDGEQQQFPAPSAQSRPRFDGAMDAPLPISFSNELIEIIDDHEARAGNVREERDAVATTDAPAIVQRSAVSGNSDGVDGGSDSCIQGVVAIPRERLETSRQCEWEMEYDKLLLCGPAGMTILSLSDDDDDGENNTNNDIDYEDDCFNDQSNAQSLRQDMQGQEAVEDLPISDALLSKDPSFEVEEKQAAPLKGDRKRRKSTDLERDGSSTAKKTKKRKAQFDFETIEEMHTGNWKGGLLLNRRPFVAENVPFESASTTRAVQQQPAAASPSTPPAVAEDPFTASAAPDAKESPAEGATRGIPMRRPSLCVTNSMFKKEMKRRSSVSERPVIKPKVNKEERSDRLRELVEQGKLNARPPAEPIKTGSTKPKVKYTENNRGRFLVDPVVPLPKPVPRSRPTYEEDIVCTQSTTLDQLLPQAFADVPPVISRPAKMTFKSVERLSNVDRSAPGSSKPASATAARRQSISERIPLIPSSAPIPKKVDSAAKSLTKPSHRKGDRERPSSTSARVSKPTVTKLPQTCNLPSAIASRRKSIAECIPSYLTPLEPPPTESVPRKEVTKPSQSIAMRRKSIAEGIAMNLPSHGVLKKPVKGILKYPSSFSSSVPRPAATRHVSFSERDETFEFHSEQCETESAPVSEATLRQMQAKVRNQYRWEDKSVLAKILSWREEWLNADNNTASSGGPFAEEQRLAQIVANYHSVQEFQQIMQPMLMRELWQEIRSSYRRIKGRFQWQQVREVYPQQIPENLCQITCKAAGAKPLLVKDLGLLEYRCSKDADERRRVLAYASKVCRDFTPQSSRAVKEPGQWFNCTFYVALGKMKELREGCQHRFAAFTSIMMHLQCLGALMVLGCSPLVSNIISPAVSNNLLVAPGMAFAGMLETRLAIVSRIGKDVLNAGQMDVVLAVLQECTRWTEPSISLIQGPPGTGKSRVISHLALELTRIGTPGKRVKVLVCAQSNTAVDVIAIRLLALQSSVAPAARLSLLRVGTGEKVDPRSKKIYIGELLKRKLNEVAAKASCSDGSNPHRKTYEKELVSLNEMIHKHEEELASNPDMNRSRLDECLLNRKRILELLESQTKLSPQQRRELEVKFRRELIEQADIVFTTLGSCSIPLKHSEEVKYDVCIIDEATQSTEVCTLLPLIYGMPKLVLVGDINQLRATVLDPESMEAGFSKSLFSRLHDAWESAAKVKMLTTQYRMHPEISSWPNKYFYKSRLQNDAITFTGERATFPLKPYQVVSLSFDQDLTQTEHEIYNRDEIDFVVGLLKAIVQLCPAEKSIAIITPYQRHRDELIGQLRRSQLRVPEQVQVKSIDSVQGKEYDVVIVSLARSVGAGFLNSPERINVALTRARHCLVLCGNFSCLTHIPVWKSLLDDAQRRNLYYHLENDHLHEEVKTIMQLLSVNASAPP